MKHFKLTSEHIVNIFGVKLFKIEAIIKGNWGEIGTKGGYIEKEENLSDNAWVYGNAQVYGDAWVSGNAQVSGEAHVYDDAWVYGNAQVYGDAQVYGNTQVSGEAHVYGNAWVYGDAQVSGNAQISGEAHVYGNAWVYGNAQVYGDAWELPPLQIQGTKHFINICKKNYLQIGCKSFTFEYWKENFVEIGKLQGYSDEQIKEYGLYIDLAINLYKYNQKNK